MIKVSPAECVFDREGEPRLRVLPKNIAWYHFMTRKGPIFGAPFLQKLKVRVEPSCAHTELRTASPSYKFGC